MRPLSSGDINENCCNNALAVIPPSVVDPPPKPPIPAIATAAAAKLLLIAADGDVEGVAGRGWTMPGAPPESVSRCRLDPGLRNSWVLDLS